ncbi:FKBP-type peptidylprolyl isomerase [Spirosoma sp. HMF3257]|uniref:Peptidyl-prolyl cis-trans isomerase n=1 Tax=Spirosoma telluris TaxID=2183553 RepID=A0A327NET0_9BACT|nr:FKBP-type peptidylprolyl isomerase [Spirosoma telluris]RAI73830.1 FKBP-type peptidylprolyl isomerase [Spirosoma telluris]
MKKYGFILAVGSILVSSCQQADRSPCTAATVTTKAPQGEVLALKQYIDSNRISAKADDRGFYYELQSTGSGKKPNACSHVTVNYKGMLTTGKQVDSAKGISFDLNQLIIGWQEGIPLLAPGGSITLYLPPSLAYGSQEQNDIPANSILIFKIELIGIN